MRRRIAPAILIIGLTLSTTPAVALDEAGEAAAAMLRAAVTPREDGAHEALLESLRRLRDPALRPFFESLAAAAEPSLQLHGLLGLAELDPARQMRIAAIGELDYAPLQAELIAAAMDEDLLTPAGARQLLTWSGLALPVKLVIAVRLLEAGLFDEPALAVEATGSEKLGQRGLGALLLHQLNDPRGAAALAALDASSELNRDAVRTELLRTAVRHNLTRAADWAYAIATDPQTEQNVQWAGLAAALRFGHKGAAARWRQLYDAAADSPGQRRLLALMLLRVAPFVDPAAFDAMRSSDDTLVVDIGLAGAAIAADAADLTQRAAALLGRGHPMVNDWALAYAERDARPDTAQVILLSLIDAYEAGDQRDRAQRLDDAAQAAITLMELDPIAGARSLRPILAEAGAQPDGAPLQQAILLGLLRVELEGAAKVIEGLPFTDRDAARLALVLRARDGATLTDAQTADLKMIVRGGTSIQGTLRIVAAWNYLQRTGQTDEALAAARQAMTTHE